MHVHTETKLNIKTWEFYIFKKLYMHYNFHRETTKRLRAFTEITKISTFVLTTSLNTRCGFEVHAAN